MGLGFLQRVLSLPSLERSRVDVLDAQTSLTDARATNVRALRGYMVALARLQRAVGWDVPQASETLNAPKEQK